MCLVLSVSFFNLVLHELIPFSLSHVSHAIFMYDPTPRGRGINGVGLAVQ